jgi:hypothetical protein
VVGPGNTPLIIAGGGGVNLSNVFPAGAASPALMAVANSAALMATVAAAILPSSEGAAAGFLARVATAAAGF